MHFGRAPQREVERKTIKMEMSVKVSIVCKLLNDGELPQEEFFNSQVVGEDQPTRHSCW